jgi:hypothetical protein
MNRFAALRAVATGFAISTVATGQLLAQTTPTPIDVSDLGALDYSSITATVIAAGGLMLAATLAVVAVKWVRKVMS